MNDRNFTLYVFAIVLDVDFVKALLLRLVLDRDGAIAVVLDNGLVNVSAGHFDFR